MKKIGFFDSGLGGISVLREAVKEMPEESYIYYGDSANAPYGSKSHDEIYALTMQGIRYLQSQDIKALVIACNTATSVAVEQLRCDLKIPVISMEPAVKPALENTNGKVLVLATPATLEQERYKKLVEGLHGNERVINCPCDRLAGLIEKHIYDDKEEIDTYLDRLLAPYAGRVDAAVLGCTHYVFIKDRIASRLPGTRLFDGNHGTVMHLRSVLTENGCKEPSGGRGCVVLNSSSDDQYTLKCYSALLNYRDI